MHIFEVVVKTSFVSYSPSSGRVIQYYLLRCVANYDLLEKFNLIDRTSEFARLYGILFYSVLSRGSQVCCSV